MLSILGEPMTEGASSRAAKRRPRVVMVSANAFPVMGGVETHIHEVAPRIAEAGFDVTMRDHRPQRQAAET